MQAYRNTVIQQRETEEKKIDTKNHGSGLHYKYEYDASDNIKNFGDNKATTHPVGPNPILAGSHTSLDNWTGSGEGEMRSGKTTGIVGGSRSQHFSMADNLNDMAPSDRKGTYTWHHLTPKYQMELVDMAVHRSFGHTGGFSLWT